jgi:ribosomal protein S12 methylthiotransferase accessory factor
LAVPTALRTELLRRAASFRHGVVLSPQRVKRTLADPDGVVNVAVPENSPEPWKSSAGGIGRTRLAAELAAIGEALERYAAATFPLPEHGRDELAGRPVLELADFCLHGEEQRRRPDFPQRDLYEGPLTYTNVFSLGDNSEVFVPAVLVGLRDGTSLSTSSGLAAGPSKHEALLRAVQELVERDALMVTWLHGVPGRQVALPDLCADEVAGLRGEALCIDATPAYSPHPVALVCGQLPLRGRRRYSLGAACRETWAAAVEKAYLEWIQGVVFAGYYLAYNPNVELRRPRDVKTFDDHAVYYTVHPDEWAEVPLLLGDEAVPDESEPDSVSAAESLAGLAGGLADGGVAVYYRDLTTSDLGCLGLSVVRALSPHLAQIGCDHEWPFLGGTVADVGFRYPWAADLTLCFPNPLPHPLG